MRASPNELTSARRLCRSYTRRTRRHVAHGQEALAGVWLGETACRHRSVLRPGYQASTDECAASRTPARGCLGGQESSDVCRSTVLSSTFNCVCPRRHRHRDRTRAAALVVTNCGGYIGAGRSPQDPCRPAPPIGSRMRAGLTSPAARLGAPPERTTRPPRCVPAAGLVAETEPAGRRPVAGCAPPVHAACPPGS